MQVVGRTISKYSVALLAIVLIGVFLRVYDLGAQSIWGDEAFSITVSNMSLPGIVQAGDSPLYHFALHYWIALFGTSEVAVRSLSVLFGVLAIPMIYVMGRRLFNEEVGLLAALILAFSTLNVQYSQEARMYSLMVLLALLSMYFFIRFLQRDTIVISVGYVVCTTLLLYTHLYGVFVVVAQNVYLLTLLVASRKRSFQLRDWVLLQAVLLALFAPWVSFLIGTISNVETGATFWAPTPTINDFAIALHVYSGTTTLLLLFLALAVLSVFTYRKVRGSMDWKAPLKALKSYAWEVRFTKDYDALYLLAVLLLAINVIPIVISLFLHPIYWTRYTIAGSVALYLIVAKGISHINFRYAKLAVVIVVVALSAANLQPYYTTPSKAQTREATSFINAHAQNGDLVLLYPGPGYHDNLLNYYSFVAGVNVTKFPWCSTSTGQGLVGNLTQLRSDINGLNLTSSIEELQSDINGHNRVWLMVDTYALSWYSVDPQILNQTIQTFNASYNETYHKSYYLYDVYLFEKRA